MKTLTWKVDSRIQTPCPDYQLDQYTGHYPTTHCLVYHFKDVTETMVKEFEDEQKAIDFVSKAPFSCYDFKLDSKYIEDKRERISTTTLKVDLSGNNLTSSTGTNKITP